MQRLFSTIVIASLLAGCVQADKTPELEKYRMPTDVPAPSALTQTVEAEIASKIPPKDCPVTTPAKSTFGAPAPFDASAPWEGFFLVRLKSSVDRASE